MKAWTNSKQYLPDANINPPTADQYQAFISNAGPGGGITSNTELAMFLAEIMWESGGLIYKSELACKTNNCAGSYDNGKGAPGKYYYGRGYMQLTWEYNYADASKDLYGDDRLFQNPDQVATSEDAAWGVSYWFWKSRVKPKLNGTYNFGLATDAINGGLECRGADPTKAKKRYQIYVEILKVFEPSATPIEAGCYN
jgi:predicted chitinase